LRTNFAALRILRREAEPQAIALVLLFGVLLSMCAHAAEAQVTGPRWFIVLTITERTTGAQVEERELDGNVTFDDLGECQSFVARVGPIPSSDNFAAVLTCHKVDRKRAVI